MTVLVTGGTGFVGRDVIAQLKKDGYKVRALVRANSNKKSALEGADLVSGNIWDENSIDKNAFNDVEFVVHLVGILQKYKENTFDRVHVQGTKTMVDMAKKSGVKKFIHMSALGTRKDGKSQYHKTKWQAEEYVRQSGLKYTIFRPSIIFGDDCEFIRQMLGFVKKPLVTPVAGLGKNKFQPIDVKNVAEFFVDALENSKSNDQTFALGGQSEFNMDELLDLFAVCVRGKPKIKMHIPIYLMKPLVFLMENILSKPPVTLDQLAMLKEDNVCDIKPALETFPQIKLTDFEAWCKESIKKYESN